MFTSSTVVCTLVPLSPGSPLRELWMLDWIWVLTGGLAWGVGVGGGCRPLSGVVAGGAEGGFCAGLVGCCAHAKAADKSSGATICFIRNLLGSVARGPT